MNMFVPSPEIQVYNPALKKQAIKTSGRNDVYCIISIKIE